MTNRIHRLFARLLSCFAIACCGLAWGAPQLLLPHDGPVAKSGKAPGFETPGFRVRFNLGELRSLKHGDEVELSLPSGRQYTVVFDLLQDHGKGDVSFIGYIKGTPEKQRVVITTGRAGSFGRISTPDGDFRLVPGDGHDWLVDMVAEQPHLPLIDLRRDVKVPPARPKATGLMFAPEYQETIPGVNTVAVGNATPTPQVFVDLMIAYTPAYAANPAIGAGLTTRLNNLVANINTMLADSEVAITLRLVHQVEVAGYTVDATEDGDVALDRITPVNGGGTGLFSNIETLRSQYGADMVMFLRNGFTNGGSGIAWISTSAVSSGDATYMYSVVTGCLTSCDWVHAHELGHNMGNMHDRATAAWEGATFTGSYPYSYGHYACQGGLLALSCNAFGGGCATQPECSTPRSGTANISDIMAYFHGSTTRNLRFSNPALTLCSGSTGGLQACGISEALASSANTALSMNNNRVALSALRAAPVPATSSTTTVASSQNPSYVGQSVTFTATVSGSAGTPTGTVHFRDNGSSISGCTAVNLSGATATCSTSALPQGIHSITAQYSGNTTYLGSTSAAMSQGVAAKVNPTVSLATSLNPSNTGQNVTFTATVSGTAGTATGTVNFRDNGSSITGCSAVALSGGAANCMTSTIPAGAHSITAVYGGNAAYNSATSSVVTQNVVAATNLALASAGTVASASSSAGGGYPVSAVNDNQRSGVGWGSGGGWEDATYNAFPDWVQLQFNGSKAIDRVVVYTLSNSYGTEPTDSTLATTYGVQNFAVEGWTGSAWQVLANVSGNTLAKRTVTFASFTTDRIRVNVSAAAYFKTRIIEIEAWGVDAGPPAPVATNVALSSTGAVASASSSAGAGFPVAAVNDDQRSGGGWGSGGGWEDGTYNAYPDWVQIQFNGSKAVDRVVVYTLSNSYGMEPTEATSASTYGIQNFTVEGWTGSAWQVLATVTGNTLAMRSVTFAAFTTDRIRVNVGAAAYFKSRIVEIEAWGIPATGSPTPSNVALASAGAVASASSIAGAGYPIAAVNDNQRSGAGWGSGGGWEDATYNAYPDWVQIVFDGAKVIDRVVVYTLSNSYGMEPTDTTPASTYGVQNFTVEGWSGSAWQVLGTVTGNTLAMRSVTFAAFTTDRIRVNVTAAAYFKSRIVEVEAWGVASSAPVATNVALATAGGVASASSTAGGGYPVTALNDNQRSGAGWGSGGGWEDATYNSYPDWVQVVFSGTRTIDRVVVYTLSNSYGMEPTDTTSASTYGIQNFTVEGWTGSAWQVLGTVTGNTLAMRSVTFAGFATDRIRINVTAAAYFKTRIVEVEAWGS